MTIRRLTFVAMLCVIATIGEPLRADENAVPTTPVIAKARPRPEFQYKSEGIEVPAASADELKVTVFGPESILAARKYLDDGANAWVRSRNCVACHSTGAYMVERPVLTPQLGKPSEEVLAEFIESIPAKVGEPQIKDGVKTFGHSIQTVWCSSGLASWDKHVTGSTSEHTDRALRLALQCLADEGFVKTIDQVEIPYITTDFDLTVQTARAVATAPGWLASVKDSETLERLERMKNYLKQHAPINDYELAGKLQLSVYLPELVTPEQKAAAIAMLWRQQLPDGGWSTRRMSDVKLWHPKMDPQVVTMIESEPDAAAPGSDPYMTGYAIVLLREAGVEAADERIQKGITWLKTNQRVSGRWWMKSLFRDTYHFSTYISTAQALRALALCGEIPPLLAD